MDHFVYRDILQNVLLPCAEEEMSIRWRFQQGNDPKNTSKLSKIWLRFERIEVFRWPDQSLDLNSIKNLLQIFYQNINRTQSHGVNYLCPVVQVAWKNIPQCKIDNLFAAMAKRCQNVIKSNGLPTKF